MSDDARFRAVSYGYQVVITGNSEYHFRGARCIGVRSRVSSQWKMNSPMVGLKIKGCALSRRRCLPLPFAGGYLWFELDGKNLFSSKITAIRLPNESEVAYFMQIEEKRPKRSVVDDASPAPRFSLDGPASSDRSLEFADEESLIVDNPPVDQHLLGASRDDEIQIGPVGTLIEQPTAVKAWLSRAEDGFRETNQFDMRDTPSRDVAEIRKRRVHVRVNVAVEIFIITSAGIYEGVTEDISEGGVCVTTFNPQRIGAAIEVDFVLFDEQHRASGVVRWAQRIDNGSAAMGVQFQNLSERTRNAIARFAGDRPSPAPLR